MEPNIPKYTTDSLVIKNNQYVVEDQGKFHYFPIKASEIDSEGPLIRMTLRPPVLMEGIAILDRLMYRVSLRDLMRGVVHKSSLVSTGRANVPKRVSRNSGTPAVNDTIGTTPGPSDSTAGYSDEPGPLPFDELAIAQAADSAWQEQTQSLLETLHQKEGIEWEIADAAQSGSPHAGGAVFDFDSGT